MRTENNIEPNSKLLNESGFKTSLEGEQVIKTMKISCDFTLDFIVPIEVEIKQLTTV